MTRSRGMVALLGATALGVGFGYWLASGAGARHSAERPSVHGVGEPHAERATPAATQGRPAPMRVAIRDAIDRAPVHAAPDLARYLDSLEARARAQRAVTALEVEPGIDMIRRYSFEPDEEIDRFTERMQALQREFAAPPEPARATPELNSELDRLVIDIGHPTDERDKQASIARYLEVAQKLDEAARDRALQRLNEIAATARPTADAQTVKVLWSAIENARDPNERQTLIASYLELVRTLPEEQSEARLAELSARFGARER